jgi:hypothetical protein
MVEADKNVVLALKKGKMCLSMNPFAPTSPLWVRRCRGPAMRLCVTPYPLPLLSFDVVTSDTEPFQKKIANGPQTSMSPAFGAVSSAAFLKGRLAMLHIAEATLPNIKIDLQPGNRAFGGAPIDSSAGSPSKSSWAKT